ncbi:ribokinase [Anaerolentibacter hominis]|uniref:ribokinase n=1 Tax=Anaerolentibacter hominis TaxID=3079009 RepID=UPI0031B82458
MERTKVTVIGSLNFDIIFKQKRLPVTGETFPADSVSFCSGGKGANQAVQCAKLGLPVYMAGRVGEDTFGDTLLAAMKKYGVDTANVRRSRSNTGIAGVNSLEDGTLHSTLAVGANMDVTCGEIDQLEPLILGSRILILQLEIPVPVVEYAIELAARSGVYVILNAAPARDISAEALKKVNCLVVNEAEASFYAGRTIESVEEAMQYGPELLARIGETLIITLGAQGAVLFNRNGARHYPPVNTDIVVETTGAGDSFVGGFAYGKYHGQPDEEACILAGKASAVTIRSIGAQDAMPELKELLTDEEKGDE